jgi:hypothetical protein
MDLEPLNREPWTCEGLPFIYREQFLSQDKLAHLHSNFKDRLEQITKIILNARPFLSLRRFRGIL